MKEILCNFVVRLMMGTNAGMVPYCTQQLIRYVFVSCRRYTKGGVDMLHGVMLQRATARLVVGTNSRVQIPLRAQKKKCRRGQTQYDDSNNISLTFLDVSASEFDT